MTPQMNTLVPFTRRIVSFSVYPAQASVIGEAVVRDFDSEVSVTDTIAT